MEELVKLLIETQKTISTMESCTGGGIANAITNIPDASKVINFSAVTYSNEYKEKMGVPAYIIDKYTVYSKEVATSMAKAISDYTISNFGIGVTGKLNKYDPNNPYGEDDIVYLAIYDRDHNEYYCETIKLTKNSRISCKEEIIHHFVYKMFEIIK